MESGFARLLPLVVLGMAAVGAVAAHGGGRPDARNPDVRLMTLDPGHFHAALVQKEMYPGVDPVVHVFAPLGPDLLGHLNRISSFNHRAERPTGWQLEVHAGPDSARRMLEERPGNVVVISGRNRGKIDRVLQSVRAGLHVLADKPWVLRSDELPALEAALAEADARSVITSDIMTERFEVTSQLQRELVNDPAVFGELQRGTEAEPAVYMESVHHLMKLVAGAPNIRPSWFFDTGEQGEGLNDIGTHLVDLVQWTIVPDRAIDARTDVRVLSAQRWPTSIPEADFRRVTGEPGFPPSLMPQVKDGALQYFCNTLVSYTLQGVHTRLNIIWDWEAPAGAGDTHFAFYRGSRSRVEVRQARAPGAQPELYVVPATGADIEAAHAAVERKLSALRATYAGVTVERHGAELHVAVPQPLRLGHEAHFAEVASRFFEYIRDRGALPAWERPNMLAKYHVTTTGTELARARPPVTAPRLAR
jgi:predicted dehydrogenase